MYSKAADGRAIDFVRKQFFAPFEKLVFFFFILYRINSSYISPKRDNCEWERVESTSPFDLRLDLYKIKLFKTFMGKFNL